jgi:HPt (histidine-containing phosphotransfer) domain-containing protein
MIAMTAHALAGDADRFLAAGMDDYLAKPVTLQKLERMLRAWLPEVSEADTAADGAAGLETIDFAALATMLGEDDPGALAELLDIFVADFPSLLEPVADALARVDRGALARAAHAGKSAAGSAAAKGLAEMMARLEAAAPSAELTELQRLQAAADQEFRRVAARIGTLSADR